jgi:WhiB family redox-sensing transcriptional regulator
MYGLQIRRAMFDVTNAACANETTDVFFPEGDDRKAKIQVAKDICSECPIAVQCLTWAIKKENFGIWGGTTPEEREVLRRSPKRKNMLLNEMMEKSSR